MAGLLGVSASDLATAYTTKSTLQQQLNEVITVKLNINQVCSLSCSFFQMTFGLIFLFLFFSFSSFPFNFPFFLKQSMDARDSLAKNTYERLWLHLLNCLNKTISDEAQEEADNANHYHIGVLDIFGFENFPVWTSFSSFPIIHG